MNDTITIYGLYDPRFPNDIRYIGRTSKSNLQVRLVEHIAKAKYKYGRNSHIINWINKLLKEEIVPEIIKLDLVEGWSKSHQIERDYIKKYLLLGYDLVNSDDRGQGEKNKTISQETKIKMSNKKKEQFLNGLKPNGIKTVIKYDLSGNLIEKYESINDASRQNNCSPSTIFRCLNGKYATGIGYIWKYEKDIDITPIIKIKERKKNTVKLYELTDLLTNQTSLMNLNKIEVLLNKKRTILHGYIQKGYIINKRYTIKRTSQKEQIDLIKSGEFGETLNLDNTEPRLIEI